MKKRRAKETYNPMQIAKEAYNAMQIKMTYTNDLIKRPCKTDKRSLRQKCQQISKSKGHVQLRYFSLHVSKGFMPQLCLFCVSLLDVSFICLFCKSLLYTTEIFIFYMSLLYVSFAYLLILFSICLFYVSFAYLFCTQPRYLSLHV